MFASQYYLSKQRSEQPESLAQGPNIIGDVLIHPTAKVSKSNQFSLSIGNRVGTCYNHDTNYIVSLDLKYIHNLFISKSLRLLILTMNFCAFGAKRHGTK